MKASYTLGSRTSTVNDHRYTDGQNPPTDDEIMAWLGVLFDTDQVIELRAPKTRRPGTNRVQNVVYRSRAGRPLVKQIRRLDGIAPALYVVMNRVNPALPLGRRTDGGAKARDILDRRWLLVDCDPERPGTVNATDEEKAAAYEVATAIRNALTARRWFDPVFADSGNGYHLLYPICLWNDDVFGKNDKGQETQDPGPSTLLVKSVLEALAAKFNTDRCHVDTGVYDLPRLVKLYGSRVCKGEDTPERPARYSRILTVPVPVTDYLRVTVPEEFLEDLVEEWKPAPTVDLEAEIERKRDQAGQDSRPADRSDAVVAWFRKALESEAGKVAMAPDGQKHNTIRAAACTLAGMVHHGYLTEHEINTTLRTVARNCHFDEKNAGDAIDWGIKKGLANRLEWPRKLAESGFHPNGHRAGGGGSVSSVSPSNHTHAGFSASNGVQKGSSVSSVSPSEHTRPDFSSSPLPIVPDLRPVPQFNPELLPDPIRAWALDIADRAQCAIEYVAVGVLIALATVIGRKVGIRPKRHDFWLVVANLWGMIVGRPGVLKTHALEEALAPLRRLAATAQERHAAGFAEFQRRKLVADAKRDAAKDELKKAAKKNGADDARLQELADQASATFDAAPPTERRYVTNDATVEKLGELLEQNPNGILQFRDELSGFLRSFEKQNRQMDRPFYLEGWNGTGSYTYDRIERGTIHIKSVCISLLGGIQPGPLASYLRMATAAEGDDGLISRFQLSVFPDQDRPFRIVDRVPNLDARCVVNKLFEALDTLEPADVGATPDGEDGIPFVRFDDEAQAFFYRWLEDLETTKLRANESPVIESHLSKYRSLMPSLALIFHAVNCVYEGDPARSVSVDSARRAADWCAFLEEHARRIYQHSADGDIQPALTLAERLKASLPNPFVARDVQRKGWKNLTTIDEVQLALSVLEDRKWLVPVEVPAGEKGGRPTTVYHVHPSIMTGQESTEKSWAGMPEGTDKTDTTPAKGPEEAR